MAKSKQELRAEKAAEALRELKRREQRRNRLTLAAVVAVIAVLVVGGIVYSQVRGSDDAPDAPAAGEGGTATATPGSTTAAATEFGVTVGDPAAPHAVVVYEDFVCPFCGELERASRERLAALADAGKVYVEYRPFDLLATPYSVDAANAFKVTLEASGPVVAKKLHDILYEQQPEETGPFPDADWYVDRAVEAGATDADVRPGIEGAAENGWVEDATSAAGAANVKSTPTILLDGKPFQTGRTIDEIADNLVAAVS